MIKMDKKILFLFVGVSLVLFVSLGSAKIIGAIGSGIMRLNADVGEEVERSILVINRNDFSVNIELLPSGDLADNLVLRDVNFSLEPGEERKAYFTIYADEPGTTETKILVKYNAEGENSFGISATITFTAEGEGSGDFLGGLFGGDDNGEDMNDDAPINDGSGDGSTISLSPELLLSVSTSILVLIFLVLILMYSRKQRIKKEKKSVGRGS